MKDSYSFDIDDAGLDASLRSAHRDAYIRIFDRLGFDYVIVKATSGAMGGSKSEEFLAKAAVGEDTYVRCTHCDYAANVEAVQVPAARTPSPYDDAPAAHAEQTPDTPTIDTLVDHLNEKYPRDDRPWTAGDTLKNVLVVLKHPDGTREPLAIGLPGDREVDQKRLEGQLEPTEVEPFGRGRVRRSTPRWSRATSAPACWARRTRPAIRYLVDPRVVEGTRWVTGADVAGSHVLDLVAGRDFTARRHHRGRRGPRRRPLPATVRRGRRARDRPRHRDGPHLPARPQVRRGARPPGARRERQARHGHDGLLRHRRLPRGRRDRRGHPRRARPVLAPRGRAGRRAPRRHRQGRRRSSRPPSGSPTSSPPQGLDVLYDDRPQGQPRREVQGRRADRRADDRRGRHAAWPTASSRSRTGRTGEREEVPADRGRATTSSASSAAEPVSRISCPRLAGQGRRPPRRPRS